MPNPDPKTFQTEFAGQTLTVETGHIAEQANGALFIRCRDTVVLVTAVASKSPQKVSTSFPSPVTTKRSCTPPVASRGASRAAREGPARPRSSPAG